MTDYHDFTTIDTPSAERGRLGVGDIWINAVECLDCGDLIRSRNRHDFVTCYCGGVSVDGGSWYCKRSFRAGARWEERSVEYIDARAVEA